MSDQRDTSIVDEREAYFEHPGGEWKYKVRQVRVWIVEFNQYTGAVSKRPAYGIADYRGSGSIEPYVRELYRNCGPFQLVTDDGNAIHRSSDSVTAFNQTVIRPWLESLPEVSG